MSLKVTLLVFTLMPLLACGQDNIRKDQRNSADLSAHGLLPKNMLGFYKSICAIHSEKDVDDTWTTSHIWISSTEIRDYTIMYEDEKCAEPIKTSRSFQFVTKASGTEFQHSITLKMEKIYLTPHTDGEVEIWRQLNPDSVWKKNKETPADIGTAPINFTSVRSKSAIEFDYEGSKNTFKDIPLKSKTGSCIVQDPRTSNIDACVETKDLVTLAESCRYMGTWQTKACDTTVYKKSCTAKKSVYAGGKEYTGTLSWSLKSESSFDCIEWQR